MNNRLLVDPKVKSVRKFYFLEYFYILLKSVQQFKKSEEIFEAFRNRKDHLQLGESKYRKLILPEEQLSNNKLKRYEYTFREVIEESQTYNLLDRKGNEYFLTSQGADIIRMYERDIAEYNHSIFKLMEMHFQGFYYLVSRCYSANKSGLLIFPIYSPLKLGIQKDSIKKTKHILRYIDILTDKLASNIQEHLKINVELESAQRALINRLFGSGLLNENPECVFDLSEYNGIVKRIRDFWLNHFLNDIYKIEMSLSYFDIWCYRGKQLGIMNATEFFYNFDGKIVYPISVLSKEVNNSDFKEIFQYQDSLGLYIHKPSFEDFQAVFTKSVFESYIDIKSRVKTYFINLADLRDLVCYKLRISNEDFKTYLEQLYQLNLKNEVRISIALETDKLPSETNAMYLTREPIVIDSQIRNIIAIDIKK